MTEPPVTENDRRRKRALIIFQIVIYAYLLGMFLTQMWMYHNRHW